MADTTIMRRNNLQTILEAIDRLGVCTTFDLAEQTGLSLATISRVTGQLKQKELIAQDRKQTSEPGRKPELFQINAAYGSGLYFNLKSGLLQGYLLDFRGRLLQTCQTPVEPSLTTEGFLRLLTEQRSLLTALGAPTPLAVCLSLPGQQDKDGFIRRIPNFPCFEGVALQQQIVEAMALPCLIRNTARLTAWGHFLSDSRQIRNLVFLEITGDCGIGAGLVLDGRLYEDAAGLAGEVGDMIVRSKDTDTAQNKGALEEDAGLSALLEKAGLQPGSQLKELEQAARQQEETAQLLHDASRSWAAAIVNLCAILSPDTIVVGGAVSEENTMICSMIRQHLQGMYYRCVPLSFATCDSLCHTTGAADLLKQFLFSRELDNIDNFEK